jgi:hypothetical protein
VGGGKSTRRARDRGENWRYRVVRNPSPGGRIDTVRGAEGASDFRLDGIAGMPWRAAASGLCILRLQLRSTECTEQRQATGPHVEMCAAARAVALVRRANDVGRSIT